MAYSVNNIIPFNLILTPAGLDTANFVSCFFFAPIDDATGDPSADDILNYTELSEVEEDWGNDTPAYYAAERWFAQTPKPRQFTVWVWDDAADTDPVDVANKAAQSSEWRFAYFFPHDVTNEDSNAEALASFADAESQLFGFTRTDSDLKDSNATDTIADTLLSAGHRFTYLGYREQATVDDDASQAYAHVQLLAAFQKFNPDGTRTAITGEYQVLPGVVGESLDSDAYTALKDRKVIFWTEVELKGETDASRTINTWTMSSFDEYLDDVFNLEVLANRAQVAVYNYITRRKRGLRSQRGYGGALAAFADVGRLFFNNGVLGQAEYTDPRDGETKLAENGFVIFSDPSDVLDLTDSQVTNRRYPPIEARAFLARAGHVAEINLTVE